MGTESILVRGSKIPAFRPSPLDKAGTSEAKIESKIAEYRQTVDGQFTTITNQIGDMLRKTDIQITPSQISLWHWKEHQRENNQFLNGTRARIHCLDRSID